MLPLTRKLVQIAGWRGLVASLGLTLLPDTMISPISVLRGIRKKIPKTLPEEKVNSDRLSLTTVKKPNDLSEAMLNSVLRGDVISYSLHKEDDPQRNTYINACIRLRREDTPWLM